MKLTKKLAGILAPLAICIATIPPANANPFRSTCGYARSDRVVNLSACTVRTIATNEDGIYAVVMNWDNGNYVTAYLNVNTGQALVNGKPASAQVVDNYLCFLLGDREAICTDLKV